MEPNGVYFHHYVYVSVRLFNFFFCKFIKNLKTVDIFIVECDDICYRKELKLTAYKEILPTICVFEVVLKQIGSRCVEIEIFSKISLCSLQNFTVVHVHRTIQNNIICLKVVFIFQYFLGLPVFLQH